MTLQKRLLLPLACCVGSLLALPCAAQDDFPRFAVGAKASTLGIGVEAGTAITHTSNVRVGFNGFTYRQDFSKDGVDYAGKLNLRSAQILFDQYIRGGFHISPGLLVYNRNRGEATARVPGGDSFSLGDATFFSNRTDPVTGSGTVKLGKASPMLLLGFGNLLPRRRHFAVNFEFGVVFQTAPDVHLSLNGSTCTAQGNICQSVTGNSDVQSHMLAEQNKISDDLKVFRYYPVVSLGFGYKF
jgi:hypothetical protein